METRPPRRRRPSVGPFAPPTGLRVGKSRAASDETRSKLIPRAFAPAVLGAGRGTRAPADRVCGYCARDREHGHGNECAFCGRRRRAAPPFAGLLPLSPTTVIYDRRSHVRVRRWTSAAVRRHFDTRKRLRLRPADDVADCSVRRTTRPVLYNAALAYTLDVLTTCIISTVRINTIRMFSNYYRPFSHLFGDPFCLRLFMFQSRRYS